MMTHDRRGASVAADAMSAVAMHIIESLIIGATTVSHPGASWTSTRSCSCCPSCWFYKSWSSWVARRGAGAAAEAARWVAG